MILTNEEVNNVLRGNLTNEPVKGYAIRIEGMTFSNDKGKILWKKEASCYGCILEWLLSSD